MDDETDDGQDSVQVAERGSAEAKHRALRIRPVTAERIISVGDLFSRLGVAHHDVCRAGKYTRAFPAACVNYDSLRALLHCRHIRQCQTDLSGIGVAPRCHRCRHSIVRLVFKPTRLITRVRDRCSTKARKAGRARRFAPTMSDDDYSSFGAYKLHCDHMLG